MAASTWVCPEVEGPPGGIVVGTREGDGREWTCSCDRLPSGQPRDWAPPATRPCLTNWVPGRKSDVNHAEWIADMSAPVSAVITCAVFRPTPGMAQVPQPANLGTGAQRTCPALSSQQSTRSSRLPVEHVVDADQDAPSSPRHRSVRAGRGGFHRHQGHALLDQPIGQHALCAHLR